MGQGRGRCALRVEGLVQGVGFRPHAWRLARDMGLTGWVRNEGDGVGLLLEASDSALAEYCRRLVAEAPPSARVDRIYPLTGAAEQDALAVPTTDPGGFAILDSRLMGRGRAPIGADAAPCPQCLAELFNPEDRHWRYPFLACTHCGPRYTVVRQLPYDRARTSLADFPLCPDCARDYGDPAHRRFHGETIACPACGPRLRYLSLSSPTADCGEDPLAQALACLRAGGILALKGVGGYQLLCDARSPQAVATLRERKGREGKPFALLAANGASVADLVDWVDGVDGAACPPAALQTLQGAARPIVLLPRRWESRGALPGVADPRLPSLGVMLPASPLHWLLFHEAAGRPVGTDWCELPQSALWVCTSANPQGEPLVRDEAEALARLQGIADALLTHDREVVARADDSVWRPFPGGRGEAVPHPAGAWLRRARGCVPEPIRLASGQGGPTILALGGHMKNTLCLLQGEEAWLSPHVGTLDNVATLAFLEETVDRWLALFDARPDAVAHDLHPDFPSTHLALALAQRWGVPALGVAHHAAHAAAVVAEHRSPGAQPAVALALDGTGLGSDGGLWGGELLSLAGGGRWTRLGHLQTLPLPGGDRATREPWRVAVAILHQLGRGHHLGHWQETLHGRDCFNPGPVLVMLARRLRCPPSSSLGRLFDGVAALLGLCPQVAYEAEAAQVLEGLALDHEARRGAVAPLPGGFVIREDACLSGGILDFQPLLEHLAALACAASGALEPYVLGEAAARFHRTVAAGLAAWVAATGVEDVAYAGGGCCANALLMGALSQELAARGLRLNTAVAAPPGDGGLALGQAWLARQQLLEKNPCA